MSQILVLEQRAERISEFRRLLEPEYKLTFADSTKDAIEKAKNNNYVLYISALHLPRTEAGENIFDFLRAMKADPKTKVVPFFCCCIRPSTMMQSMADLMSTTAKSLGVNDFELVKDGELSLMPQRVKSLVDSGKRG